MAIDWAEALGFLAKEEQGRQSSETTDETTQPFEGEDEDEEPQPSEKTKEAAPHEKLIMASVVNSVVENATSSIPELNIAEVKDATKKALMELSPEFYTPETVMALLFMNYGLYSLNKHRQELQTAEQSIKENPRILLDDPFRQKVEALADQWGLNPDDLLADFFAELEKRTGVKTGIGLFDKR